MDHTDAPPTTTAWLDLSRGFALATFALAVAASVVLSMLPVYSSESMTSSGDFTTSDVVTSVETSTGTLLSENGPAVLVILAIPVVAALPPLLARRRVSRTVTATVTAVVLLVLTVIGAFSIGIFYVPATLCAVVAAVLTATRRPAPAWTYEVPSGSPTGSTS